MKPSLKHPKLGIISGVGPLAGSDVFAKVLKHSAFTHNAVEDNEYPELVLVNHGIEGVDNIGTLNNTFETEIIQMVKHIEDHGANIIGIACNTAHIYLDKIKTNPETIFVNLVDAVASQASIQQKEYLLLTSSTSKQQKLYHGYLDKYSISFQETTDKQQGLLDEAIGLVMAHKLDEAGKKLQQVFGLAKSAGFNSVIAGCTELPIAIEKCKNTFGIKIIDSNEVLAECLTKAYYQIKRLQ